MQSRKNRPEAVAYLRTSSATNLGAGKDSDKRQRDAIEAFAKHSGFDLVAEYFDAAVSGADPIEGRPGFKALLDRIVSNGVRTVIVEDASRFARTLMVQEAGIAMLVGLGVQVITSRGDDLTESDDEMRVAMRQIVGVFSQLEKTRLVKKLLKARERKRATGATVEGRLSRIERAAKDKDAAAVAKLTEAVAMAKRLRRANPKTGERMSYQKISAALAAAGHLNERGAPLNHKTVRAMILGPMPKDD
jgi:DNA invertase Pin-like site-specific DNA recombinase